MTSNQRALFLFRSNYADQKFVYYIGSSNQCYNYFGVNTHFSIIPPRLKQQKLTLRKVSNMFRGFDFALHFCLGPGIRKNILTFVRNPDLIQKMFITSMSGVYSIKRLIFDRKFQHKLG